MDIASSITGFVLGIASSWIVAKIFAKRSSEELEKNISKQASKIEGASSFINFERLLRSASWRCEHIGHEEVWVCEKNNLFQFKASEDRKEFREKWTAIFADQNGSMFHINLMINGTVVRSIPFVSGDGGRYTLPLPDLAVIDQDPVFCWYEDSIDVRIAEIIGNYYRCKSIKEVARLTKVELVRGNKPDT